MIKSRNAVEDRKQHILRVASVLKDAAKTENKTELNELLEDYTSSEDRECLKACLNLSESKIQLDSSVLTLMAGLNLKSKYDNHRRKAYKWHCLALGLESLVEYLVIVGDWSTFTDEGKAINHSRGSIAREQQRYFAFCFGQLIECGVKWEAAIETAMNGAFCPMAAQSLRELTNGADFNSSALFTEKEQALWKTVFRDPYNMTSWLALQLHFSKTYQVPLVLWSEFKASNQAS